jgi:hypothetical protein
MLPIVLLASSARSSYAGSCKGDKKLDTPMKPTVTTQSAARVHLTATAGYDRTGGVVPIGWRLYDGSGTVLDYFPTTDLGFAWNSMLGETNLEGLTPQASYSIELVSRDVCGNTGTARQAFKLPAAASEIIAPSVSSPTTVLAGYGPWMFNYLYVTATDATGLQSLSVSINGTVIREYDYSNDTEFHWWCDDFPQDGVQSVYESPSYYINYPETYKGQYVLVEVVAVDTLGNRSVASSMLSL